MASQGVAGFSPGFGVQRKRRPVSSGGEIFTFTIADGADDGYLTRNVNPPPPDGFIAIGSSTGAFSRARYAHISGSTKQYQPAFFRWDTSSLTGLSVGSAKLRIRSIGVTEAQPGVYNIYGMWMDNWVTSPTENTPEGVSFVPLATACDIPLGDASLSALDYVEIELSNAGANVNTGGYTALYLFLMPWETGPPSGANQIAFDAFENIDGHIAPQLIITTA